MRFLSIGRVKNKNPEFVPISLLVTFRNEAENIKENFSKILAMDYAYYEIIAVDDFSQDNSLSLLGILQNTRKKLKISSLNQETSYSVKHARNIGLKAAKNNFIMVIPTSIREFGNEWIPGVSESITDRTSVVINYSNVLSSGKFYQMIFRIENFLLQLKSAAFILNGVPFIFSEDNVAFDKQEYYRVGAYGKKIVEPYANLELVINKFISKKGTKINFTHKSAIWCKENIRKKDYMELLKKSFRVRTHLTFSKRLFLFIEEISGLMIMPFLIIGFVFQLSLWQVYTGIFVFYFFVYLLIIKIVLNGLKERKIFIPSLVYGIIAPYFKLFYRWRFNHKSRKQKWNNH